MRSSSPSNFLGSDLIPLIKGCVLGLAIAVAGVSSTYAIDGSGDTEKPQAEVTSDAELDVDAAAESSVTSSALSVDPTGDLAYPDSRPSWVDEAPNLDDMPRNWPVKSLLCESPEKARESLEIQAQGAMAAYAELVLKKLVGEQAIDEVTADRFIGSPLLAVDLDSDSLQKYVGSVEVGGETRYEEAVLLSFDKKFDRRLVRAWKEEQVQGRLSNLAVAGGAGLFLLMAGTGFVRRIARRHQTA